MKQEPTLVERLRKYSLRSGYAWYCHRAADRIEQLERENAELKADAERYRWLRDEAQWLDDVPHAIIWKSNGHVQEVCAEDELDEAIDAAMKEQTT